MCASGAIDARTVRVRDARVDGGDRTLEEGVEVLGTDDLIDDREELGELVVDPSAAVGADEVLLVAARLLPFGGVVTIEVEALGRVVVEQLAEGDLGDHGAHRVSRGAAIGRGLGLALPAAAAGRAEQRQENGESPRATHPHASMSSSPSVT